MVAKGDCHRAASGLAGVLFPICQFYQCSLGVGSYIGIAMTSSFEMIATYWMSEFDNVVVLGIPFDIYRYVREVVVSSGRLYTCHILQVLRLLAEPEIVLDCWSTGESSHVLLTPLCCFFGTPHQIYEWCAISNRYFFHTLLHNFARRLYKALFRDIDIFSRQVQACLFSSIMHDYPFYCECYYHHQYNHHYHRSFLHPKIYCRPVTLICVIQTQLKAKKALQCKVCDARTFNVLICVK
jgi:hypothetical protein